TGLALASEILLIRPILLIAAPLIGWASATAYPALGIVGGMSLQAMRWIPQSEALATQLFEVHEVLTLSLLVLVAGHIGAALVHWLVKRDGVVKRMGFGGSN